MKLIHGECLEEMDRLIEQGVVVDAIIADVPFGTTRCKWDSVIPFDAMWERLNKIIKPNGAVVLFGSEPFSSALRMSNIKNYKYDWTWQKPKGTGHLNAKRQPLRDKEDIAVFYAKQCTYNPQMTDGKPYKDKAGKNHASTSSMTDSYGAYTNYREDNKGKRYPKQIQKFPVVERGTLHPTQKPVALLEYLIKTYTNEGDTVLDFTIGSGTTGIACQNTGRKFVGIEMDDNYFKIAEKRISENESSDER